MLSKNQLGFLYMFLSICGFSLMDVIVKWSVEYPIGQILFFRGFFGILFYFFVIPRDRLHNFYQTKRLGLHLLRCISGLIAIIAIFIALRELPLATVVSISFAAPIFTTIFSIFLLSEKVGVYRWLAVLVGFIGILIITEPGINELNIYYIYPIIFCLGLSYVAITLRQLSSTEPVWLISLFFSFAITSSRLIRSASISLLAACLITILFFMFVASFLAEMLSSLIPIYLPYVESLKFGGFTLSLIVGVTGIVASFPLGIVLALGRQSDLPLVKMICVGFIEFIRGVPLITLLFVASVLLNYFLPPGSNFDIVLRVIIMVTLFSAAYMAEVIRGGLAGLPVGQHEASAALGLTYWQSQRLIVMPQALKISIPGIVNTFIGLYKDTTLVVVIGLLDPLGIARASLADTKWNGLSIEVYIFVALFFFVSCLAMSRYSLWLENKLNTDHK